MSWRKLDPAISSMPEPKFLVAVHDHFLKLFPPRYDSVDRHVAALFRSRDGEPLYYFSPGTADLLTGFGGYPFEPFDRPDSDAVTSQIGPSLAVDTAWIELPHEARPYPELDQELDKVEAGYWGKLVGSGGKRGSNGSGPV